MLNKTNLVAGLAIIIVMIIGFTGFGLQLHKFAEEGHVEAQKALDEKKTDEHDIAMKVTNDVTGNIINNLSNLEVEFQEEETSNNGFVEMDYQNDDGTITHYGVNQKTGEVNTRTKLEDGTVKFERWEGNTHTYSMIK